MYLKAQILHLNFANGCCLMKMEALLSCVITLRDMTVTYPILKYMHNNAVLPEVITTGSNFMSISVPACKICMIDSLNFIPMPLAEMLDAFSETELAKEYFPHLFNRQECNFKRQLAKNADMKTYINDLEITLALEPRDAFYGGCTEGFTLYDEASEARQ